MFSFSEHEKMILKVLGRRKMSIQELSDCFYHSQEVELPERNYVAGVIRRINAKCEREKLPWTLLGKGAGRGGRKIWRGKRARRK